MVETSKSVRIAVAVAVEPCRGGRQGRSGGADPVLLCCGGSVLDPSAVSQYKKPEAGPKIPTAKDAAKHKAGGGNVKICT